MAPDRNGARVLYVCGGRSFFSGNLNRKIVEITDCWRRAGHDVKCICGGDFYSKGVSDAGNYGSQETYTRWYRKIGGISPLVTSVSEWRDIRHDKLVLERLKSICIKWKPDIVWERSCRLHHAGLILARLIGAPYVLEWKDHLIDYRVSLFRGKALRIEAGKNGGADQIVVESGVLHDQLINEGIEPGKLMLAHNAVRLDHFSQNQHKRATVRGDLGVNDDTILVGYLGSYAFYHDTVRLILAADIIRQQNISKKIRIVMVGAGKEYPDSRDLAEDRGLLNNVVIMKPGVPTGEVPGILAALDVAVLPGSTDTICPIKITEYMASALPTLVPDYACNREVIEHGRTGLLFQPRNEKALASGICTLAKDAEMRKRIGCEARREVQCRFTWEATWGAALNKVLKQT